MMSLPDADLILVDDGDLDRPDLCLGGEILLLEPV